MGLGRPVVPDDQLITVAGLAARLADGPTIGIGHIKGQLNDAYDASMEQAEQGPRCSACAARPTAGRRSRPSSSAGRWRLHRAVTGVPVRHRLSLPRFALMVELINLVTDDQAPLRCFIGVTDDR